MKIEIIRLSDAGVIGGERVVMRATEDADVGQFLIARARGDEDGVFPGALSFAYWFPDVTVKKDDLVVLYTRRGSPKTKKSERTGRTTHFFYAGKAEPLFSSRTQAPVLFEIGDFSAFLNDPPSPDEVDEN